MNDHPTRPMPVLDRPRAFAWFSLLAGVASILLLIASMQPTAPTGAEQLSFFAAHRGFFVLMAIFVLVWAVFSIPFVAALGQLLRAKSPTFALAATILSAIGILLLGFAIFARIGAFLSILAAGSPPTAGDATYQAAIWGNLFYFLTDPGLMTWGLGQLLFGWLA
jgi:hypothetical protein